jgi:hypothetical protein
MKVKKSDIKAWQAHCKMVQDMSIVNYLETDIEKEKRVNYLKNDFEAFCNYYFKHYVTSGFAKYHLETADALIKNKKIRLVAEWYRSAGKSVLFNVLLPCFLVARNELWCMVLVGKSEGNAIQLLSDIQAELQFNERFIADYGIQVNLGSWETGKFITKDGRGFFALGKGMSPRGLRVRSKRIDYAILDDVLTDAEAQNDSQMAKLFDWTMEALFPAMSMGDGRFILVSNRLAKQDLIGRCLEIPGIYHSRVDVYQGDEPAWKERYTKEQIEEVRRSMGEKRFSKEYLNTPLGDGEIFQLKHIMYKEMVLTDYDWLISYTDPSYGSKKTNDFKSTIVTGMKDGEYHVLRCYCEQTTIKNMIAWWYEIQRDFGSIPIFYYMESNFILQDVIFDQIRSVGGQYGYEVPIVKDSRKKPEKSFRIESTLYPLFEREQIFLNRDEREDEGMKKLVEQTLSFSKSGNAHEDSVDALEGAVFLHNLKRQTPAVITLGKRNSFANKYKY